MLEIKDEKFLLVASDVHDDENAFEVLTKLASDQHCLGLLYAGDLNVENYFIATMLKYRNFVFLPVLGNCDNPFSFQDVSVPQPSFYRTCEYNGLKIFLSHGHRYYSPCGVGLNDADFDLVITGHSHKNNLEKVEIEGKTQYLMNPGSPSQPRGFCDKSYGLIRFPNQQDKSAFGSRAVLEIRKMFSDSLLAQETILVK